MVSNVVAQLSSTCLVAQNQCWDHDCVCGNPAQKNDRRYLTRTVVISDVTVQHGTANGT